MDPFYLRLLLPSQLGVLHCSSHIHVHVPACVHVLDTLSLGREGGGTEEEEERQEGGREGGGTEEEEERQEGGRERRVKEGGGRRWEGREGGKKRGGEMSEEGNMRGREGGKEERRIRNRESSSIEQKTCDVHTA